MSASATVATDPIGGGAPRRRRWPRVLAAVVASVALLPAAFVRADATGATTLVAAVAAAVR